MVDGFKRRARLHRTAVTRRTHPSAQGSRDKEDGVIFVASGVRMGHVTGGLLRGKFF